MKQRRRRTKTENKKEADGGGRVQKRTNNTREKLTRAPGAKVEKERKEEGKGKTEDTEKGKRWWIGGKKKKKKESYE